MFKIKLLFIALLIPIVLSACGKATPTLQPLPSPTGKWTVSMHLSGGIAGLSQSIEILSDGAVTAKDERSNRIAKRQLISGELTKLASLISSASLQSPTGHPTGCADCFNYNIQINSDSGRFTAQLDDVSLPDSGMELLVRYLGKLMNQMLAGG